MINRILLGTLFVSLMIFGVTRADVGLAEGGKSIDVIAAVFGVNHTTELFGKTYKQAVILYRDHSEELADLPDLINELKNEIRNLKAKNKEDGAIIIDKTKATVREKKLTKTLDLLAEQLPIKNLVKEYDEGKDWPKLKKGLGALLDHKRPAYSQLQSISDGERFPPWQISFDGNSELVYLLVFSGKGINMTDRTLDTLLHGAVGGGRVSLVEMLLDNGADIEFRNDWGNAPLALACKYRRLEVAKLLWARGADLEGIDYHERVAGLGRAAEFGDLEIVKFMVSVGASTTRKDKDGNTALEIARRKGFNEIVEYLSQFPH